MSEVKISIITATLNALAGLKNTVGSVASQTYRNVEHVVIDGGSEDGTTQWLTKQAGVRWISEPDSGIADALNKALDLATGEWILVLHAEDTLIDKFALSKAAPRLHQTASDVVCFGIVFASDSGDRVLKPSGMSRRANFKTPILHQGAFCRRSLFVRLGQFDTRFKIALDYEFFLRAYRARVSADVVDDVVARMPDTGVSSRSDWKSLRSRFSEERKAQLTHVEKRAHRVLYAAYWPLYLAYRKARWWAESFRLPHLH